MAKKIIEIHSIREMIEHLDEGAHVFLDIDNTLLTSPHDFGSERWEYFMIQHFMKEGMSEEVAVDRACELWKAVQTVSPIEFVEKETAEVIGHLRERKHPLFAVTSRGIEFQSVTEEQLASLGIEFCQSDAEYSIAPAAYARGVFYCGKVQKGVVLKSYVDRHLCPRIVMVDDLARHLESAVQNLEIPFTGLRYGYLDPRKRQYIADETTKLLWRIFSHPEACKFLRRGIEQ